MLYGKEYESDLEYQIATYYTDNAMQLLADYFDDFPDELSDWLGDKPETESSYREFLEDYKSAQKVTFDKWATSYIEDMLRNDMGV